MGKCSFIVASLFLASLSLLERVASVYLAIRYSLHHVFSGTDSYCMIWTLTFVLLPICLNAFCSYCCTESHPDDPKFLNVSMGLLGLMPQARFISATKLKLADDDAAAAKQRSNAICHQMVEIVFGALPQFCLQLYVLGHYGEFDRGFSIALVAQALFVAYGIVYYTFRCATLQDDDETETAAKRKCFVLFFFVPWSILFLLCCVPLFLFASLYADGSLDAYAAVIIYFLFHLLVVGFLFHIVAPPGFCEFTTILILGILFSFASWSFSSFWFVSLAPALDSDRRGVSGVPAFIWPHPTPYFAKWIAHGEWRTTHGARRCKRILQCQSVARSTAGGGCFEVWRRKTPLFAVADSDFFPGECLLDRAEMLYTVFEAAALTLLCYNCLLAVIWRKFGGKWAVLPKKEGEEGGRDEGEERRDEETARVGEARAIDSGNQGLSTAPYPPSGQATAPYAPTGPSSALQPTENQQTEPSAPLLSSFAHPEQNPTAPPPSYDEAMNMG